MRLFLCSACLVSVSLAQVAPGEALLAFSSVAPFEGLVILKRTLPYVHVTGLMAQGLQDVGSAVLDPIDSSIWIGSGSVNGLRRTTLTGTVVGPATLVATPANGVILGISFDQNGNPIVAASQSVFRVDRATGAVTNLLSPHPALPAGFASCVDVDLATGDIYFGKRGGASISFPAGVYVLPGPYPNTAAPVLLGSCNPASSNPSLSSIAFRPAQGATPARVYWTTWSAATTVGYLPAAGGLSQVVLGAPTAWPGMNSINYDRTVGDFWLSTSGPDPDRAFTMTDTGANTLVATFNFASGQGGPTKIDANDAPPGSLRAIPQYLPATPTPVTVEVSMSWTPGDIGIFGIVVGGTLITFGLGIFDGSGTLSASFPATLSAGAPGAYAFFGASLGLAGLQITGPLSWPAN